MKKLIEEIAAHTRGNIDFLMQASEWTWLGVGGAPLATFSPADAEDLQQFLKMLPKAIPYRTFGAASNVLIRDAGYSGIFIRLKKGFRKIQIEGSSIVADAGLPGNFIVNTALEAGLGGISFMATIPGHLGGLAKMNAGAHGNEMQNIVEWVEVLHENQIIRLNKNDCGFGYRKSAIKNDMIVLRASLKCTQAPKEKIKEEIDHLISYRKATQPTSGKMAGCFFKNPAEKPAWQLVKETNLLDDNVEISSIHANFLINKGAATAFDIEYFMQKIRCNVFFNKEIWMESEVEIIGDLRWPVD